MGRSCSSACRDDSIDWCRMSVNGWEEVVICLQKKRVGGTCRLRTRSSPLLDIHHAHVRVDVCRTSAEVLPEEVLVNGEDTDTTPSHAYAYLPTSVPHHTSDYLPGTLQVPPTLHLTTPHHFHTTPLPYHNKHPATATNTATTTITAIINQAADRCLPSAP